jgi:adenosylhomocysteine nucleosidase
MHPGRFRSARFNFSGNEILMVESGMGFNNAARGAEMILSNGHPDLLITTGFCGGIATKLDAGDVIVAKNIVIADKGGYEEIPVLISKFGHNFVARESIDGSQISGGTFVSASAIISKKSLAAMLSGLYTNPVVEMESGAIAIIAAENNIPLLAIRAVCDSAAEELRFSLDEFCSADLRRISLYKVMKTVLQTPRIIPQLVRLSRSRKKAAGSLTAALYKLFSSL